MGANTGECIILGMFGPLGGPELVLILVLALIVFGPRRLPEIGKSMGRLLAEFRKASHDFQRTIEDEVEAEKQKPSETILTAPAPPPAAAEPQPPSETTVVREVTVPEPVVVRDGPAPPPWTETK
jgi:TatA/E family protein of Tat protein translocase